MGAGGCGKRVAVEWVLVAVGLSVASVKLPDQGLTMNRVNPIVGENHESVQSDNFLQKANGY